MALGNIQALQSLVHSAAVNAGYVQESLDEAETYWYENAAAADRAKQALQVIRGRLEQGRPLEAAPAGAALESSGRPGTG